VPGTGLSFTLPVVPANQPDNATGNGHTIALGLAADAKTISFVGTGTEGNQNTTGTATFSDGSTVGIPMQFSDWALGGNADGTPSYGNIVVAKSAYRLHGTEKDSTVPFLFATAPYQIPAGKTLVSVTLPTQTGDPGTAGRIHVFAVADDGTPRAALAVTAPKDQTAAAGQAITAQLGTVTGGVADSAGYRASVQWGDGTVPQDAAVDGSGAIGGKHTYAQPGTYTVHITAWDTLSSSTATFTVTVAEAARQPAISVASARDELTVDGTGFAPGEQVRVNLGNGQVGQVDASAAGTVHTSVAAPPAAEPGRYAVTATGASSRTPATATVRVADQAERPAYHPQVTLSVTAGPRGTAITVDGAGFAPNETVTGRFGADLTVTALRANGDGVIGGATISVPGSAKPGPTVVTLAGGTSAARVERQFTVTGKN
jgi:hypothetical protein